MIKLLGIPYDANSSYLRGAAMAPQRIRLMDLEGSANQYNEALRAIIPGETYEDLGDLSFHNSKPEQAYQTIFDGVSEVLNTGAKLLSIGGDHSVSYPIVRAHLEQYAQLHILHLDAHADLYHDFEGNPYSHASPFARILESGKVGSLTQVGIRTLNRHQWEQADNFGVRVIEMKDVDMAFVQELSGPLYISLDMDVLDPAFAPGVSHHEPGGMSTRQLLDLLHEIDVEVIGADLVEYNPARDVHNMTAMVGYKLMKELIGLMF